jgi:peptide/nickel transport system substrate-binding protein
VQIAYTDQSGAYIDPFIIPPSSQSGLYTVYVTASKSGYSNAQNQAQFSISATTSSSNTITTSSTSTGLPGKCLIATASYGSELSPEVSTLRNLRDNEILKTSVGTYFMKAFNAFYYSFSPQAASYISSNNNIRTITKTLLYPLVGILYLSSIVFSGTSFNGEFAVTVAGMFASISLGAVYVGPIITTLSRLSKKSQSSRLAGPIRIVLMMLAVSLVGLCLAEAVQLAALLTAAAVGTVLSCIVLGSLFVPWILTRSGK